MICQLSLVPPGHHMQLIRYYWAYSLCRTLHRCDCFVTTNWPFLVPSSLHPAPHCAPLWQSSVCSLFPCVWFGCVCSFSLFFRVPHTSEIMRDLSFSLWLTPLSIPLPGSIGVVANGDISFCFKTECRHSVLMVTFHSVFHGMYEPQLLYPIVHQLPLWLLSQLGYCK